MMPFGSPQAVGEMLFTRYVLPLQVVGLLLLAASTGIEWFNTLGEAVSLVTGLIFVACVLLFRKGIVGEFLARAKLSSK